MWRDSTFRRLLGAACCFSFLIQSSGCTGWATQKNPPAQVLSEKPVDHACVIRNDGSRVDVYQPRVVNDTLTGFARPPAAHRAGESIGIPVSDVRSLELRRFSAGKTLLLAAGVGATVLIISAIAWNDFWDSAPTADTTGSCPVIYTWDGKSWRLDSGTYGGAVMPALQRTDLDNLLYATPGRGVLWLRLANELAETEYIDALWLLAVDHPYGVTVLPAAGGGDALYSASSPAAPLAARDERGQDLLGRLAFHDGIAWESALRERDPANPADTRDGIELAFRRPIDRDSATLVLEGQNTPWTAYLMGRLARAWGRDIRQWYDPATADSMARAVGPVIDQATLQVQVWVNGAWQPRGRVLEIGPEITKQVAVPLDLSGVSGDTMRVRLESIPNLWRVDYVGLDASAPASLVVHALPLDRAELTGSGDVRGLLAAEDRDYLVLGHGAVAELSVRVPAVPRGMMRSYLARTTGWYRIDSDEAAEPDAAFLGMLAREGAPAVAVRLANQALVALH